MRIRAAALALVVASAAGGAHADMASYCAQTQDIERTLTACTEVIESGRWAGENLAWAYYNRALAKAQKKNPADAIADYSEAIRLKPTYANAYAGRGTAHAAMDDRQSALRDLNTAIKIDSQNGIARFRRARLRCEAGDAKGSIEDRIIAIKAGFWRADDAKDWLGEHGYYQGDKENTVTPELEEAVAKWSEQACK